MGPDLTRPQGHRRLTGPGSITAPIVLVDALHVGSLVAHNLAMAIVALPPALQMDGLLGLDFFDLLGITQVTLRLDTTAVILR